MAENYVPVSDEDRRWAASTPEGGLVFRGTFAPAPSFLNDPCGEAIRVPYYEMWKVLGIVDVVRHSTDS